VRPQILETEEIGRSITCWWQEGRGGGGVLGGGGGGGDLVVGVRGVRVQVLTRDAMKKAE